MRRASYGVPKQRAPFKTVQNGADRVFARQTQGSVQRHTIISRASKTTLLRSATLFAHTCASAGECGARLMACPWTAHRRGQRPQNHDK